MTPRQPRAWTVPVLFLLAACTDSGGGASSGGNLGATSRIVLAEDNQGGNASQLILKSVTWGRLVDVAGLDGSGQEVPMLEDFVIGESVVTDGIDYQLEINPVTARETLTILRDVTDEVAAQGATSPRDQFFDLLSASEANLSPVFDSQGAGLLSLVRRNATLVLRFNDLLNASTIDAGTVRTLVGVPAIVPFQARVLVGPNHGGIKGGKFHPTRVLIDTTISQLESFASDPPLSINGVGLPASADISQANVELRIPIQASGSTGQSGVLTNLSGRSLAENGNGTIDFSGNRIDLVRRMRSGGPLEQTGDDYNGYLPDNNPPQVIGSQPVEVLLPPVPAPLEFDAARFLLPEVVFASSLCARAPRVGDVLTQPGVFVEVLEAANEPVDGSVTDLVVRLLQYPFEWDALEPAGPDGEPRGYQRWIATGAGQAQYLSVFDPQEDGQRESCFVQAVPSALGFPGDPTSGLATHATLGLRFSEPMDPVSVTAFDSMTLTRLAEPEDDGDYVVGSVRQSLDLASFTFIPDLDLAHENGLAESYYLSLTSGDQGPTDLAGNPLVFQLPRIEATLDASEPTQRNGGRVSRFEGADGQWGGQILFDLSRELVKPRPVLRFDGIVDPTQLLPAGMNAFDQGVQTPLSNLGSKLQTVWRHADMGFSVEDNSNFNLDVEGLSWAPVGGQVTADVYSAFEIRLSHSRRLPDEYVDPGSGFPLHNKSGLLDVYATNVVGGEDQRIVHPAFLGYTVSPGDLYAVSTGTVMLPFPLNRSGDQENAEYFTWRDTTLRNRAAPLGNGAEIDAFYAALGQAPPFVKTYDAGEVRSVALPLLMEFRTFEDDTAFGLNAFEIRLASNSSAQPYFRAFSTGGEDGPVDPDNEPEATGGWDPILGVTTYGRDNSVYMGAADFVVRISRAHSVWFPVEAGGMPLAGAYFSPPVLEPTPDQQPLGTEIDLDFRAAESVAPMDALTNALALDSYGDYYVDPIGMAQNSGYENEGIVFVNGFTNWYDTVEEIAGAKYYQVRVTFTSNAVTGNGPELSAVALSWEGE